MMRRGVARRVRRRDQNILPGIEDIREGFNVNDSEGPGCGVILTIDSTDGQQEGVMSGDDKDPTGRRLPRPRPRQ